MDFIEVLGIKVANLPVAKTVTGNDWVIITRPVTNNQNLTMKMKLSEFIKFTDGNNYPDPIEHSFNTIVMANTTTLLNISSNGTSIVIPDNSMKSFILKVTVKSEDSIDNVTSFITFSVYNQNGTSTISDIFENTVSTIGDYTIFLKNPKSSLVDVKLNTDNTLTFSVFTIVNSNWNIDISETTLS